jgi:D-glycero-D-manno-heptose 1,7-bisphosphate phosphatase
MAERAVFLDCDGTLIEDPGYINRPEQVRLLDGVPEALVELKNLGYKLVVVSNQSGVARGMVTEKALGQIHDRLKQLLGEKGAVLDQIYYCPYHPEGIIEKYRKESDLRKPGPGMLLAAAEEMNIDLNLSWTIGNSVRDVEAGRRAGCKTILINQSPGYNLEEQNGARPDHLAVNMKEAVNIIKQDLRSPKQSPEPAAPTPLPQDEAPVSQVETPSLPMTDADRRDEQIQTGPSIEPVSQTEMLLKDILEQLKAVKRQDMFTEFSAMRLLAGVLQIVVLFCLVLSIWLLLSPTEHHDGVLICLAFAIILQLMVLTFYLMPGRK